MTKEIAEMSLKLEKMEIKISTLKEENKILHTEINSEKYMHQKNEILYKVSKIH